MCCYSLRNRKLVIAGKGNLCVCVMIVLTRRLSSGQRRNGFRIFMLPLKVEIYEGNYEYFQKQKTFYSSIILTLHLFLYFLLYISLYVAAVLLYFQNLCAGLDLCFYSLSLSLSLYIYIYINLHRIRAVYRNIYSGIMKHSKHSSVLDIMFIMRGSLENCLVQLYRCTYVLLVQFAFQTRKSTTYIYI